MKFIITIIIGLTFGFLLAEYDTYLKIQDKVYYDYYTHQDKPPVNLFNMIKQSLDRTEKGTWKTEYIATEGTFITFIPSKGQIIK